MSTSSRTRHNNGRGGLATGDDRGDMAEDGTGEPTHGVEGTGLDGRDQHQCLDAGAVVQRDRRRRVTANTEANAARLSSI